MCECTNYNTDFVNRFGGVQLRSISKLMSTTSDYKRNEDFSLGRSEVVKLDSEENRCDDNEAPINLEDCYRAYAESQVGCQSQGHENTEMVLASAYPILFTYSFSVHFHGGATAPRNTQCASQKMTTISTGVYTTLSI